MSLSRFGSLRGLDISDRPQGIWQRVSIKLLGQRGLLMDVNQDMLPIDSG